MSTVDDFTDGIGQAFEAAAAAEAAILELCRATLSRPNFTPVQVSDVLQHLAGIAAALPQAISQLSDVLDESQKRHLLAMDSLTKTTEPSLAIDMVRLHLDAGREASFQLHRRLDTAHQETAHITTRVRVAEPRAFGE